MRAEHGDGRAHARFQIVGAGGRDGFDHAAAQSACAGPYQRSAGRQRGAGVAMKGALHVDAKRRSGDGGRLTLLCKRGADTARQREKMRCWWCGEISVSNTLPAAPVFGSVAAYTTRATRAWTRAIARIAQGSSVTY